MSSPDKARRLRYALELAGCAVLVTLIALNAMRRMDYFGRDTAQHIRMTDESRTALVAKNLVEGNGYTTNDLPAALVDFYDERGKLHAEHWPNADRFPFAAYATAALYTVTQSTSWVVGIVVYNLLAFVAFLVCLYAYTRWIWKDRYTALGAVAIALVHAYTFQFLYWKDGDMLLLATLAIWSLHRYLRAPASMTRRSAIGLGTLLAFVFLARPNLGVALGFAFTFFAARRLWRARSSGAAEVLREASRREGLALLVTVLWCVPFIIQTWREWGQPLFSANNIYQLPLGTRFGMATDTWWKYTEPHHPVTLARLLSEAPGQLGSKFTSSWVATWKSFITSYALELVLAASAVIAIRRKPVAERPEDERPVPMVTAVIGFALLSNLALLPLYGYQDYSYRHYLGFVLPLMWVLAARALIHVVELLRPSVANIRDHVRAHASTYLLVAVVALLASGLGATSTGDTNRLFVRVPPLLSKHWVATSLVALLALSWRWVVRPPWFPRLALASFALVYACYRPAIETKRVNFAWFPSNDRVWDVLRANKGLVSSFALQGEVAWHTGRKNIPAPEWPMHVYSFLFDHQLEVEDVYIESAADVITSVGGLGAAGFEGYARLQSYRHLPGYEIAFHDEGKHGYPKFHVKPRMRASTVYHLVDRDAVRAMAHSPERIELGDPATAAYTPHGWTDYYTIDGKSALASTDVTRSRYAGGDEGPWEDAGITFFIDDRHPKSFDLEIYATHATTLTFYWNLDLYEWNDPDERARYALGTVRTEASGWQQIHLEIPERLLRNGLNKLGFRSRTFQTVALCPASVSNEDCLAKVPVVSTSDVDSQKPPVLLRPTGLESPETLWMSVFATSLVFHY